MNEASSMSIASLIGNAGPVVQLVMLILLAASVVSWVMIVTRFRILRRARQATFDFEERFWAGENLAKLFREVKEDPDPDSGPETIFRAGFEEYVRLSRSARHPDALMEGTQRAMRVALQREQSRLTRNLPFLATVGSTSPYVGLFGTVWGIMNSFRALANVSQATLAVVAPGIAEALVATAMGLFAAIPAVIAYNRYAATTDELVGECELFAEEFSSVLHRQAHDKERAA
jgi:biopolymer transport protein TolQ